MKQVILCFLVTSTTILLVGNSFGSDDSGSKGRRNILANPQEQLKVFCPADTHRMYFENVKVQDNNTETATLICEIHGRVAKRIDIMISDGKVTRNPLSRPSAAPRRTGQAIQ